MLYSIYLLSEKDVFCFLWNWQYTKSRLFHFWWSLPFHFDQVFDFTLIKSSFYSDKIFHFTLMETSILLRSSVLFYIYFDEVLCFTMIKCSILFWSIVPLYFSVSFLYFIVTFLELVMERKGLNEISKSHHNPIDATHWVTLVSHNTMWFCVIFVWIKWKKQVNILA